VIALLAKPLGVAKSAISVSHGETARLKTLAVAGDGPALVAALAALDGPR